MKSLLVNQDAFADGQIGSKLWLCEELEKLASRFSPPPAIAIYGGWYGLLGFLLLARDRLPILSVRSLDIDPKATEIAEHVGRTWELQGWKFKAFTRDCSRLSPWPSDLGAEPDLIVNTACEHFDSLKWWENIRSGTCVALQSTDQEHEEHRFRVTSLEQMRGIYGMKEVLFQGIKEFRYERWSFRRFMIIGVK